MLDGSAHKIRFEQLLKPSAHLALAALRAQKRRDDVDGRDGHGRILREDGK